MLDADLGLANLDVVLNLHPKLTLHDVFTEKATLEQAILPAPGGFSVLLAGSGMVEYSRLTPEVRDKLLHIIDLVKPRFDWVLLDGGNSVNDAMMAGTLDFAGAGAPGFIELWARARGIPNVEVIGISGLSTTSLSLNANRPGLVSLRDFTPTDRIAVPGIRTSLSAVVLQMVASRQLGPKHFAQLDSITVNLPHPQAMQALIRRENGVTAHFTSPPFSTLELRQPGIHRVVNSVDVLGPMTLDVVFAPKRLVDTEPALAVAFLGALDEATRLIAQDPRAAAALYAASSGVGVSHDDVMRMLAAPDTRFSVLPNQLMDYVEFLYLAGTIKAKPRAWHEMFAPMLDDYRSR